MTFYYTYVLKCADHEWYIGFTENIGSRLKEHRNGKVTATINRRPLELVYYEACLSMTLAMHRERQLKTGFGRAYLKRRLSDIR